MMGEVKFRLPGEDGSVRIGLSGSLGNDDLPLTVPKFEQAPTEIPARLWELLTVMPEELSEAFWRGNREDGSLDRSLRQIRLWARKNVLQLRRLHVPEQKMGVVP